MAHYRKVADSSLEFLALTTLFGVPLLDWIERGVAGSPYASVHVGEVLAEVPKRVLYERIDLRPTKEDV